MNRRLLTGAFILMSVFFIAGKSYAWNQPPVADINYSITPYEQWVCVGTDVPLNGDWSYDTDGYIVTWQWDVWYHNGEWTKIDTKYGEVTSYVVSDPGSYRFNLRVRDNDGEWCDYPDLCYVYVVEVDLNISGVDDDDELDPGGYVGLNGDREIISLSIEPDSLSSGTVKLDITSGTSKIEVWDALTGGNKVIPDGQNYYKTWTVGSQPGSLYVEGINASDSLRDVELRLSFTKDSTTCDDKVKFTVVEVDLDISGVADADEESVGEVVVLKFDNNGAPRKELILRKVEPTTWSGNVILSRSGGSKVEVFDSETGGTEITFNGSDNKFANSALPKSLWVEGNIASDFMRDLTLELEAESIASCEDKVNFSVLWVNLSTDHSGSLETDNAGRDEYSNLVVPPPSYALGYHLFCTYSSDFSVEMFYNGRGSEFIGSVNPSNFDPSQFSGDPHILHLARERVSGNNFWGPNGHEYSLPTSPGDDTSGPPVRDLSLIHISEPTRPY